MPKSQAGASSPSVQAVESERTFTLAVTYTPSSFIAGRMTQVVLADLAVRDGSELSGDDRRAIMAALTERKLRKATAKAEATA